MSSSADVIRGEAGGAHMCDVCGGTFAEPARLKLHYLRVHAGYRPFKCEMCGKSFGVKGSLVVHRKIHAREMCWYCGRGFKHGEDLQRHLLVHTRKGSHECTECRKTFTQSGHLTIHMRSHTGEKPYACLVCNKGFATSQRLNIHSRIHTGERPYACDLCDKAFTYKQGLKLHRVVHFGGRLYASKKAFDEHILTHGLSRGASQQSTLFQQDSDEAVVSSSTPNPSSTRIFPDTGNGNIIHRIILKCLNSSSSQQSQRVYCLSEPLSNNNFQDSQEQKQQQSSLIYNYSKVDHHDSDAMDFRHIPPLIPIDSDSH